MEFRWNNWNLDHATKHGVSPSEAEHVVRAAVRPWPKRARNGTLLVIGRGSAGRWVQVAYVAKPGEPVYVIHARPLTDREKHRTRNHEA